MKRLSEKQKLNQKRINDSVSRSIASPGTIAPTTVTATGKVGAAWFAGATQTLSGAGAADVVTETTKITSTGVDDAITLANGIDGQTKTVLHDVDGGSFVLTPTTKAGWSTFTSTAAGESITMRYVTTRGWIVIGSFGGTIA